MGERASVGLGRIENPVPSTKMEIIDGRIYWHFKDDDRSPNPPPPQTKREGEGQLTVVSHQWRRGGVPTNLKGDPLPLKRKV